MGIVQVPTPASGKTYSYAKYTSTQTVTLPSTLDGYVDVIIVGGGGSGGRLSGGNNNGARTAGGAGGETVIAPRMPIAAGGSLTLTVGAGAATKTTAGSGVAGSNSSVALSGAWTLTSAGGVGGLDNFPNTSTGATANTLKFLNATTINTDNSGGITLGIGGSFSMFQSCKEDFPSSAGAGNSNNLAIVPAEYRTNATAGTAGTNATGGATGGTVTAGAWWSGKGGSGEVGTNGGNATGGGGGGGAGAGTTAGTGGTGGAAGANTGAGGGGGGGGQVAGSTAGNGGAGGSGFIILGYWS